MRRLAGRPSAVSPAGEALRSFPNRELEEIPRDREGRRAERVLQHLEIRFELDEEARALRKRPPLEPHGMARGE